MDERDLTYFETQYDPQARIEAFSGFGRKEMATDCRRLLAECKKQTARAEKAEKGLAASNEKIEGLQRDLEASKNLVRAEQEAQKRKVQARVEEIVALKESEISGLKLIIGVRERTIADLTVVNEKIRKERDETEHRNAILDSDLATFKNAIPA